MFLRIALPTVVNNARNLRSMATRPGVLLGCYEPTAKDAPIGVADLTSNAAAANKLVNDALIGQLACSKPPKCCTPRTLFGLDKATHALVTVVNVGKRDVGVNNVEQLHEGRENVRQAIANGVKAMRSNGATVISVDPCGFADAAAEAATMAVFAYDEQKTEKEDRPKIELLSDDAATAKLWQRGVIMGECQNISRRLGDMPCNLLNPTLFAEEAKKLLTGCKVEAHDEAWARAKGMNSYLSVNAGSAMPAVFLEVTVEPTTDSGLPPIVLVGKGVCFDTGGISIKPSMKMDAMRADMMGAACVLASAHGLSQMKDQLKRRVIVLTPLVENVPGNLATKPGDIVRAMNGKTIKIDNTDAEGRLILADALCYADEKKPACVIDVATLTGAVVVALGCATSAVMSNDDALWSKLHAASVLTGDRVWRLPVWKWHTEKMAKNAQGYADLNNIASPGTGGGASLAAAFLQEFTTCKSWAHVDIAGVMTADGTLNYVSTGMSGRCTRTLMQFVLDYEK